MKKYNGLDYLRCIMCFGIIAMHMQAKTRYLLGGFLYNYVIPSFTDFVFIFMAVSAFGMCCGYYSKVMNGQVDWSDFYKKRYSKVWFFFASVVALDLLVDFSPSALYEAITELTLLHGFVPNELTVIGVGWFLGTVFVFYLVFPFFCTLLTSKRSAIIALAYSVVLNCICESYFGLGRSNFLCSFCFFVLGGLIFLYKDEIEKIHISWLCVAFLISAAAYYFRTNVFTTLLLTAAILSLAIAVPTSAPKWVHFLSGISLEMYLSHMAVYQGLKKLKLTTLIGDGWMKYIFILVCDYAGTVAFAYIVQRCISVMQKKIRQKRSAAPSLTEYKKRGNPVCDSLKSFSKLFNANDTGWPVP